MGLRSRKISTRSRASPRHEWRLLHPAATLALSPTVAVELLRRGSAARGRVIYAAPFFAPAFAVIALIFAAFHPRGLSLGIRNGQNRGWQHQTSLRRRINSTRGRVRTKIRSAVRGGRM